MSKNKNQLIAGLDIGATKVAMVIGSLGPDGIEILGLGKAPNTGVRHGLVVNIEATSESIRKARDEAELMAGVSVENVWVSIGGTHISSFDSHGMVAIKNETVEKSDIDRVIEAAKAVAIPQDRQVLHVLPKHFKIDGQEGISDPTGMSGVRLECSVHIITAANSAIQNTQKCVEAAGLKSNGLVLQQLAAGIAVLNEDERQLGVTLVDIGGGTCDLVTFKDGAVIQTGSIPVGGLNFTNDVAVGIRTTQIDAEKLKKKYGTVLLDGVSEEEAIQVEGVGGHPTRTILRKNLCQVIEARADETLSLINKALTDQNLIQQLGSGLVVSGGTSHLNGFIELANFVLDIPVRQGIALNVGGLADIVRDGGCATLVGLLNFGMNQRKTKIKPANNTAVSRMFRQWTEKAKDLFS